MFKYYFKLGSFKKFHSLINRQISYSKDITKCKMIAKKYINHNTFTAEYQSEDNSIINIPVGMHVNVM